MKITIYELLGLIKEGKAPNKIKYQYFYWSWTGDDYKTVKDDRECFLITGQEYVWVTEFLNDEVEIIKEKEMDKCKSYDKFEGIDDYIEHLKDQIDNLIDVINDMRDKE